MIVNQKVSKVLKQNVTFFTEKSILSASDRVIHLCKLHFGPMTGFQTLRCHKILLVNVLNSDLRWMQRNIPSSDDKLENSLHKARGLGWNKFTYVTYMM